MQKYIPKMYKKNIFDVNYEKLKKNGIKCILFDLDNTLLTVNSNKIDKKIGNFINKLKKDFSIYVISNNSNKKRLEIVTNTLDIPYIYFALKPLSFGFKKIIKKYGYKPNEMCIIGDQIVTDVLGGNRIGIFTILIEPLESKELKITSINRFLERKIIQKMENLGKFKKGVFYEWR